MYKVFIVDDEAWIVKGLKKKIEEIGNGFEVVGTASNAREAFEKIEAGCPDIVITDIVMPEVDGLELIEKIKFNKLPVSFIITSGFEEFEYAKRALSLGVVEYILKPVKRDDLKKALEKVRQLLDAGQYDDQLFIKSIKTVKLLDSMGSAYIEEIQEILEFGNINCNFAVVSTMSEDRIDIKADDWEISSLTYGIDRSAFFISFKYPDDFYERIRQFFTTKTACAGISRVYQYNSDIKTAWRESQIALYNRVISKKDGIYFYDKGIDSGKLSSIIHWLKNCCNLTDSEFSGLLSDAVNCIGECDIKAESLESVYDLFIRAVKERYVNMDIYFPNFYSLVRNLYDINEIFLAVQEIIEGVGQKHQDQVQNPVLVEIISYLKRNITQDITLGGLANRFYMNQSYLSQLFRKETNKTFSELRNELRIDLAKEKLKHTSFPIVDICGICGFKDYYHFYKMFKRLTGVTPSQFRQQYGKGFIQ